MILEVRKGCFAYPGQKEVLHDISFGLEKGSVLAVLGPPWAPLHFLQSPRPWPWSPRCPGACQAESWSGRRVSATQPLCFVSPILTSS